MGLITLTPILFEVVGSSDGRVKTFLSIPTRLISKYENRLEYPRKEGQFRIAKELSISAYFILRDIQILPSNPQETDN